ncbi:MAG: hypothetical protein HOP28_09445 [Gemmatimonadales bacterium]|nr:hypothetical protein [Gemmatimonadales bacterium]
MRSCFQGICLILLPATAMAQRQGLVSTFGDSMKITNGFSFSADGRKLFTSEREAIGKQDGRHVWRMHGANEQRRQSVTLFEYDVDGPVLRNRRRLPFANDSLDYYPLLSHDGRRLLFNSRRPIPGPDSLDGTNVHVWMVEARGGAWGPPQYVDAVNLRGFVSQYAQQLADTSLLFVSNRPGSVAGPDGRPSFDLWEAAWKNGTWQAPTNLGFFNTGQDEEGPFIDRTGRLLFFKRNSAGESHVFVSVRENGRWRPARQVYLSDFGGYDEHSPRVSADGRTFYFSHGLTVMHIALDELLTAEERALLRAAPPRPLSWKRRPRTRRRRPRSRH